MTLSVGQRILYNNDRCTIKYIGHINQWGNDVEALGIEFDVDVQKGKNAGLGYFKTFKNLKQGLFSKINTKLKDKVVLGIEFEKALYLQYSSLRLTEDGEHIKVTENESVIEFNSKVVEKYGFDELCKYNANFKNLHTISLDNMGISTFSINHANTLVLPNLKTLDLSRNLFTSFGSLIENLHRTCPNLETLNLTSNNFNQSRCELSSSFQFRSLKVLNLTSCCITKITLFSILSPYSCLNNLEDLNITNNYVSNEWFDANDEIGCKYVDKSEHHMYLRRLNLSNNCFTHFPWIIFKILPNIQSLDLSANEISIIPYDIPLQEYTKKDKNIIDIQGVNIDEEIFRNVRSLNLNYNNMQMLDLDILNYKFAELVDLQINYNLKIVKQIIDQCTNIEDPVDNNDKIMKFKSRIKYDTTIYSNNYSEILHLVSDYDDHINDSDDAYEFDHIINDELFVNTIYRFNKTLQKLNKSSIMNERKNSELYFISKFKKLPYLKFSNFNNQRFEEICYDYNCKDKFEAPHSTNENDRNNKIKELEIPGYGIFMFKMLKLHVEYDSKVLTINIFESCKVNQLKTKIKEKFGIHSILNIQLSYQLCNNKILQDLNNNEDELSIYNIPNNTYINFKYIDIHHQ